MCLNQTFCCIISYNDLGMPHGLMGLLSLPSVHPHELLSLPADVTFDNSYEYDNHLIYRVRKISSTSDPMVSTRCLDSDYPLFHAFLASQFNKREFLKASIPPIPSLLQETSQPPPFPKPDSYYCSSVSNNPRLEDAYCTPRIFFLLLFPPRRDDSS